MAEVTRGNGKMNRKDDRMMEQDAELEAKIDAALASCTFGRASPKSPAQSL